MRRQKIPPSVRAALGRYYGGKRCVVTKTPYTEYHHLDDDSSNSVFENLVPLAATFNCPELRDAKVNSRNSLGVLSAQLEPEALLDQARLHFAMWETALAYGCARLSYFIATYYLKRNIGFRVRLACAAMYFARSSVNCDLISDILRRDMRRIAECKNSLEPELRTLLIYEIAGILSENGRYDDANWVLGLMPALPARGSATIGPATYAAFLRRRANSIIAERGLTEAAQGLLYEAEEVQGDENIRAGIANSMAWGHFSDQNYSRAMDVLFPIYDEYKKRIFKPEGDMQAINVSAWNAAEVFHGFGVAATRVGGRYSPIGKDALVKASMIYAKSGARPFLLRENFWKQEQDLHEHARVSGNAQIPLIRNLPDNVLTEMRDIIQLLRD